jgi:hypothetical protein
MARPESKEGPAARPPPRGFDGERPQLGAVPRTLQLANPGLNTPDESKEVVKREVEEQDRLVAELVERLTRPRPRPTSPECPVCMEEMAPPTRIFQCGTGHLLCGVCRPKLQECPSKCGQPLVGRALGMEQYIREQQGL